VEGRTYAAAGVSLATAESVVERLRAAVESTGAQGFGAFAGLYPLDERRFLAASTDGVGTKLILARERGALRACGADLAAHCINDVVTTGATAGIIFTEWGVADLYGKSLRERATALIAVAHPDHRAELTSAARRRHLI